MINEPLLDYKFIPPCPPSNDIKTNESEAIARQIAEFLQRGGNIKQSAGNQISKEELAKAAKVNLKLLGQVLAGDRLPDANEKRSVMAVLGIV